MTPRFAARAIVAYAAISVIASIALAELAPRAPADLHLPRTFVFAAGIVAFALPAALIIDRYPRNPVGWIMAWVAVFSGVTDMATGYAAFAIYGPGLPGGLFAAWLMSWTYSWAIVPASTLLPLLFPNGHLPSVRWRPVAILAVVATIGFGLGYAFAPAPLPFFGIEKPIALQGDLPWIVLAASIPLYLLVTVLSVLSLVRRAATATALEREQLKWIAYSATLVGIVLLAIFVFSIPLVVGAEIFTYALLALPISVGVAVRRYRLYDIDLIIRRTLVYGVLSVVIAVSYAALVVIFQSVLRPLTGGSEIAVAGSTLATLALIQPLRARINDAVDRRFYRARYDAARVLDAFTSRLRNEVDIDSVRRDFLDVVGATVQPAHANVWLRETS